MTREEAIEMQNTLVLLAPLIADMLTDNEELKEEFIASLLQTKVVYMGHDYTCTCDKFEDYKRR